MVHPSEIESRLGGLGFKASRWFKPEINELQHILMEDEKIVVLACGRYFGSYALLVATDQRLLLIDKRVFFMTVEDTRYDMISEIDYSAQAYSATVTIFTMNKTHKFTSIKFKKQLRDLTSYVQRRVMEIRQHATQIPDLLPTTSTDHIPTRPVLESEILARPALATATIEKPKPAASHVAHVAHNHFGHMAHLVGSTATRAAHSHYHLPHPHWPNPYTQGSLVTRRPMVGTNY